MVQRAMTTPRRRWSYSLRTLFAVVTLLCCFFAYQVHWIRERHEFLAEPIFRSQPEQAFANIVYPDMVLAPGVIPPQLPWSLRFFGELPVIYFMIDEKLDPKWATRPKSCFRKRQ